ncbi:MAG TPA: ABC transporter ATP-binding protein [Paenibacillaceae bacterium]|nr:ABC transporter ATP-binding protein [Paenibacillaceae bacterium]
MLLIQNCYKTYQKNNGYVFENLNLELFKEKTALIGENGVGKTTLLKIIVGLIKPDQGQILLNGENLYQNPKLRKQIGYVPSESFFYEKLTVKENLELIGSLFGVSNLEKRINEISIQTGIINYLDKSVGDLSTGMKKKLTLAGGFLHNPQFLILDEPFNALDISAVSLFYQLIADFPGGILFTTHIPETIYQLADRILLLKNGSIQEDRRKKDFSNNSALKEWMSKNIKSN